MTGSNLPGGTYQNDPRAPWNQPEAPECEECHDGMEWDADEDGWLCPSCSTCDCEPDAEDIAHAKAEASDAWQARGGGGL